MILLSGWLADGGKIHAVDVGDDPRWAHHGHRPRRPLCGTGTHLVPVLRRLFDSQPVGHRCRKCVREAARRGVGGFASDENLHV